MPVIPYIKNPTWADGSGGGTSIDAADLNKIEAGVFEGHQMPAVRVFHNANQTVVSGTPLVLAFNSERFDTVGGAASTQHDTVTNNSRLTALHAGKYQITGVAEWGATATATGIRGLYIRLNGTTIIALQQLIGGSTTDRVVNCVTCLYDMAVNDYVELVATQTSGNNATLAVTANYSPEFMMVRVG